MTQCLLTKIFHTGRSESRLRDVFKAAQQEAEQGKRTILFFDEVDALCPMRVSGQDHEVRVVAQMLTLMDGATRHAGASLPKLLVSFRRSLQS